MAGLVIYDNKQRARYELAKCPEVVAALDTTDRIIYKSQFARPASDYSMPELLRELPNIIKESALKVGCRVSDGDMAVVTNMAANVLSRYYNMLTLSDFATAFEMCALGELDKYLPKRDGMADRGHYQMFNTEYIAKVLRAYRLRRAETMRKAEDARPKEAPKRDKDAERREWEVLKRYFLADYYYYKYHLRMPAISPAAVVIYYKVLARLGWVDERLVEVTGEEQAGALAGIMAGMAGKRWTEQERTAAKRKEIERAFRDMVEDEIQFDKFI